ncbi:hypothetical protein J4410_06665 [Candidatus Woesearchaeota archaeon]|nr:hypothetical protein [Candidatus Woesearchaeota archaeon]
MSAEESRVMTRFRLEVNDHALFCRDAIKKGNQREAKEWFNELILMEDNWTTALAKLDRPLVATGSWARGYKILDTAPLKQLARARLEIVRTAINDLFPQLRAKGWIQ